MDGPKDQAAVSFDAAHTAHLADQHHAAAIDALRTASPDSNFLLLIDNGESILAFSSVESHAPDDMPQAEKEEQLAAAAHAWLQQCGAIVADLHNEAEGLVREG